MAHAESQEVLRPHLYVMKISHFCERARWGLDHMGVPYEERAWAPGLHVPLARRVAKQSCLPILMAGKNVVQGSDAILTWAGLHNGDAALEQRFEVVTGPLIREHFYAGTLHDPGSNVREMLLHDVPAGQAALARAGWPLIQRAMAAHMAIRPEKLSELERRIDVELDWADTLVTGSGLLGRGKLGRDIITAASLLAPLARPDTLPLYRRARLPAAMELAYERWSTRPALRWVREMYAQHRHGAVSR